MRWRTGRVASPPIRPRILKGMYGSGEDTIAVESCIASDPTEDTESGVERLDPKSSPSLHRLRSDRGY